MSMWSSRLNNIIIKRMVLARTGSLIYFDEIDRVLSSNLNSSLIFSKHWLTCEVVYAKGVASNLNLCHLCCSLENNEKKF